MGWTFDLIEHDWLAGSAIAASPAEVVEAFNRAERILGGDWIESSRTLPGGRVGGQSPTLHVVAMGQRLAAIEGLPGSERLIDRLRGGDESALAELTAISLFRSQRPFSVELYPPVTVGEHPHEPDFRLRAPPERWTYVEVTQPAKSVAYRRARAVLDRLTGAFQGTGERFALEVFLRREPDASEVDALVASVRRYCAHEGERREDLGDLGMLLLNGTEPGHAELRDHLGEPHRSRIAAAAAIAEDGETKRHIVVRLPFTDKRAKAILSQEARQLPKDAAGLIMVQTSNTPGAMRSWESVLRARFHPAQHTPVSAVCLFGSGLFNTPTGEAWVPYTKLIENPHASFQLPPSVEDALRSHIQLTLDSGPVVE